MSLPLAASLTIIVPVFNEEDCLYPFAEAMNAFLAQSPIPTQVLFVDDGSTDNSLNLIKDICHLSTAYGYLALDRNYGLSTAFKAGIDQAASTYIGYIDADLQTSPMDFLRFLPFLPAFQMVNGIRQKRKDTFIKRMSSKIANAFRQGMIRDGITDTCCPLKIMDARFAKQVPFFHGMHRFLPALIQLQGGQVKQVPVQHFERFAGQAKYHLWNRLWGPLVDTFAFRWMRQRYIRYQVGEYSRSQALSHDRL